MIWKGISALLCILCILGYLKTRNYQREFVKELDKKEHTFSFLYGYCLYLLLETRLNKYVKKRKEERLQLAMLELSEEPEQLQLLCWCKRLSLLLLLIVGTSTLTLATSLSQVSIPKLQDAYYLERKGTGEGDDFVELDILTENREKRKLEITVPEEAYTEEEYKEKLKEAKEYVLANYLGENENEQSITKPLLLMQGIPNSAIGVSWTSWNQSLVDETGKLKNGRLEQAEPCSLTCTFTYGEYSDAMDLSVMVLPAKEPSREEWCEELEKALEEAGNEGTTEKVMKLPDTILGQRVSYEEPVKQQGPILLAVGVVAGIALWIGFQVDVKKRIHARDQQMLMDYPELINKFILLIGAGMTVQGAWGKIATQYEMKLQEGKRKKRYAYEEWCRTYREMTNGVTELQALDHFGQRCRLMPYLKFATLLGQNLRKGSKGLLSILEYEAMDAFEERKQMTKRLAEEAGTKLLAPMMLMLLLVMVIIMAPAFMSL